MAEHVAPLLPMLIEHLNPWYVSICNNAAWSIGEIAMQAGPAMEPVRRPAIFYGCRNRQSAERSLL